MKTRYADAKPSPCCRGRVRLYLGHPRRRLGRCLTQAEARCLAYQIRCALLAAAVVAP